MQPSEQEIILRKQIEVLKSIPWKTIAQLGDTSAIFVEQKSIITMEDFLEVLNKKRPN